MIGPKQRRVLDLLADGPYSLGALIARVGGNSAVASQSILGLERAGLVVVIDRRHSRRWEGAMVALAEPAAGSCANLRSLAPTRRPSAELVALVERLRG